MPDRKNNIVIGFPDPNKYLKSGSIHDWAKVVAILIFSQNGDPLAGATLGVRQIETVCWGHVSQLSRFWENLNQTAYILP